MDVAQTTSHAFLAHVRAQAQVAEVAAITAKLTGGQETDMAQTGVTVAGVKYMFVRGDESEIYVKKVRYHRLARPSNVPTVRLDCDICYCCLAPLCTATPCSLARASVRCAQGNTGVLFAKCNTCILVGYHDDKVQTGACCSTVGKLADFLKENSI